MGAFSVQFSAKVQTAENETKYLWQYPHQRPGQHGDVDGVDPSAAQALRAGQKKDGNIKLGRDATRKLAATLTDGGRISAYEKPVMNAAILAAKGQDVYVTDATGHWRSLTFTKAGAKALFDGVRGVKNPR